MIWNRFGASDLAIYSIYTMRWSRRRIPTLWQGQMELGIVVSYAFHDDRLIRNSRHTLGLLRDMEEYSMPYSPLMTGLVRTWSQSGRSERSSG